MRSPSLRYRRFFCRLSAPWRVSATSRTASTAWVIRSRESVACLRGRSRAAAAARRASVSAIQWATVSEAAASESIRFRYRASFCSQSRMTAAASVEVSDLSVCRVWAWCIRSMVGSRTGAALAARPYRAGRTRAVVRDAGGW
ncbi:hypothetical protein CUT44_13875 [Streptomyces carminius]|uniref:Uncharacterized protein n=1 Tax=Streptomyces carminius TaxID=2665496 RepID=A0A2M8LZ17_9ACTN|nr:hypothetical protein CUT44_13875 [Streptomyces carminius]